MGGDVSPQSSRDPNQGYSVAFWLVLGLALAAVAGWLLVGIGAGWSTLGEADLSGSAWQFVATAATAGYVGAWLLGVILAASLHRWLWLIAIVLFPPSAVAFALIGVAAAFGHRHAVSDPALGGRAAESLGGRS